MYKLREKRISFLHEYNKTNRTALFRFVLSVLEKLARKINHFFTSNYFLLLYYYLLEMSIMSDSRKSISYMLTSNSYPYSITSGFYWQDLRRSIRYFVLYKIFRNIHCIYDRGESPVLNCFFVIFNLGLLSFAYDRLNRR